MKYITLILITFILFTKCKERPCEAPVETFFFGFGLDFKLNNQNDNSLIGEFGTKYRSEDVKLETTQGEVLPETIISGGGTIGLIPMISEDWSQLPNRDIERTFFLFLPDTSYVSGYDVDTLKIEFRAVNRYGSDGCRAGFEFERFNVTFNNKEPYRRNDSNDDYKFYTFRK